ncbi:hypothetical protein [Burkholderia ubonensis]|uniref:hypothetical protein n=1 Tax=Burkholderia ubonensis TaxID=101571 RepID=UPI0012FCB1E2|nr:hypothetical protein [Burkholderia ubonensis]
MFASKLITLLGALAFSASAAAITACGFTIPDDSGLNIKVDEGCTYVVQGKKIMQSLTTSASRAT